MPPSRDNLRAEQFFGGTRDLTTDAAELGLLPYDKGAMAPVARYTNTGRRVQITPDTKIRVNQPTVTNDGVARQMKSGNRSVMLHEAEDGYVALDGHHRLVASRLKGEAAEGEIWAPTNQPGRPTFPY